MLRASSRSDLEASVRDGVAFSFMQGFGEAYLPAFALALGHGEVLAGLMATLPFFFGSVLQLPTPRLLARLGSHRQLQVGFAGLQIFCFGVLIVGALHAKLPGFLLLGLASLYWASTLGSTPPWSAWMEALVPARIRARFFATRSQVCQVALLGSLLLGGGILDTFPGIPSFAWLFGLAALSRALSAYFVQHHRDLEGDFPAPDRTIWEQFRSLFHGERAKLLLGLACFQVGAHVASGFYCPFLLKELGSSTTEYTLVVAAGMMGRILALPWLGSLAQRKGPGLLLGLGALGIVPTPLLWYLHPRIPGLLAIEFASGVAWAAYDLGVFLILFELIPRDERTALLSAFNLLVGGAMCLGALLGAGLLFQLGGGTSAYGVVFVLSAALRALVLPLFARVSTQAVPIRTISFRTLAARPAGASLVRPVFPGVRSFKIPKGGPSSKIASLSRSKLSEGDE